MGGYRLSGLRKAYGDRVVLDIREMSIREGELLVVLGPSGAGKSTLLRMLHYLEAPTAGVIAYSQSHEILYPGGWPVPLSIRRRIGMVFQRPELIEGSVNENVSLGLRYRGKTDPAAVAAALDQVGIRHLAEAPVHTLSGGELQRTAIARILAYHPDTVLFDEPTANLDPANVAIVEEIIRRMHALGTTIVLVTHNVFQARRLADRVAFLLGGELVETTEKEKFFTSPSDQRSKAFITGEIIF
jgi:tungstate transport system ATP-binding protein